MKFTLPIAMKEALRPMRTRAVIHEQTTKHTLWEIIYIIILSAKRPFELIYHINSMHIKYTLNQQKLRFK